MGGFVKKKEKKSPKKDKLGGFGSRLKFKKADLLTLIKKQNKN